MVNKMNWIEQGLKDNYDMYNKMLTELIASNRDTEGNIINQEFDNQLAESIRRVILDMNTLTHQQVTNHITEYQKYAESDDLKNFLASCQRFCDKIPQNLDKAVIWITALGEKAKAFWHGDDEIVAVVVFGYILDYLNGLEKE